jgi:uncharacterized protein
VNPHLEALLALQERDDEIARLEARVAALAPRYAALDAERAAAERQLASTRAAITREEQRQRDLSAKADDFRRMNARAVSHMDQVRKPNEATAARTQVDISRRALTDVESELGTVTNHLIALRESVSAHELALMELDERQAGARRELDEARGDLDSQIAEARERRRSAAAKVDAGTLVKYDRVRTRRRQTSVFALRGASCSNCDTTVPTQRRSVLAAGDTVDVCESCGVLLYAKA